MRTGFRFDPPRIELDAATQWVFARAFGPVERPYRDPVGGRRALAAADAYALTARIGARVPREVLAAEVGEEAADVLFNGYRHAAARAVAQGELCRQLAAVGTALGIPTIFLKGAALQLTGRTPLGARESCDVDVLVPSEAATGFQSHLIDAGYGDDGGVASEHQLLPIHHPSGLVVEVHTLVRGVRVGSDGASATAGELLIRGLCRRVEGLPDAARIPDEHVLACHLMVHGFGQHGMSPASYPITRFFSDVQDLSVSQEAWGGLLGDGFAWIRTDVSREEVEGVISLMGRLAAGEDPRQIAGGDDPEARLLRHAVAGTLDRDYRHALKLRHYSNPVVGSKKARTLLRNSLNAVWLNDVQVELIYGTPSSRIGYLGWKLWRPFDLVVRAARYGSAWVGHRRRRSVPRGSAD